MTKTGYQEAKIGTATFDVATTTGGFIAVGDDTPTASKKLNLKGVKAENSAADNVTVVNVFMNDIIDAVSVENISMTVEWSV